MFVFCSFAPSPHGYSVSRGVPNPKKSEFLDSTSLKTARICKYNNSLKSQNFDGFSGFLTGSCEGAYLAYVTEQGSVKTPKRREIMTFYSPFVVDFLSKSHHILHFDHGAVVKDCFAVEFAEYLMRKHADYADVQGCLSVENRGEIHFKTAVV